MSDKRTLCRRSLIVLVSRGFIRLYTVPQFPTPNPGMLPVSRVTAAPRAFMRRTLQASALLVMVLKNSMCRISRLTAPINVPEIKWIFCHIDTYMMACFRWEIEQISIRLLVHGQQ